jgi:hypothetical protein
VADICKKFIFHAEILSQILLITDFNLIVVMHCKQFNVVFSVRFIFSVHIRHDIPVVH